MPQFVRNKKTGQVGYFDGQKVVPLTDADAAKMAAEGPPLTGIRTDFDMAQPGAAEDVRRTQEFLRQQGLANPAERSAALDAARTEMLPIGESPEFAEQQRQAGRAARAALPGQALDLAISAAPAMIGGVGAGNIAAQILKNPRFVGRLLQRVITGAGSAAGEFAAQEAGLNEENMLGVVGAGIGGMAGGVPKKTPVKATGAEASARRTMAAEPLAKREAAAKAAGKEGFERAVMSADIDSKRLLDPLERVIAREASRPKPIGRPLTPEEGTRAQILNALEGEWATLGDHLELFLRYRPGRPGQPAPAARPSGRTAIPADQAPTTAVRHPATANIGQGTTASGTPGTPGRVGLGVRVVPTMISAENIVDDVQRLGRIQRLAEARGATDLAQNIKQAVGEIRAMIPGYDDAAAQYAKSKGFGEAKEIVRAGANPANRVRNLLEGRRATTFTPAEKKAIIRAAERGEGIGVIMSRMIRSPIGQKFLKAGITPDGQVQNAMIHLGLQFMLAEGGSGAGLAARATGLMDDDQPVDTSY